MASLETLQSFVNTWECDENDHMNVQFYFSRFEEADRQFRLMSDFSEALVGARRVRHVRYHAELRAASPVTVNSYAAFDGPHMFCILHEMVEASTGQLAATAVDGYTPNPNAAKSLRQRFAGFEASVSEPAMPRSLPASPYSGKPTQDELLKNGAFITGRATVLPRHLDVSGRADDTFVLACISDASAHAWERTPMTTEWLDDNDFGRISVEQKLSWISPLTSGDMVAIVSTFTGVNGNSFNLRHHVFEQRTRRLAAVCDMVVMAMDLDKRTIVPLDKDITAAITALLG
ncbi:acyl-CoA thioesterase [Polycladidibacter hongkongensis]|uniref:acyl-CoA thioesterase n=1 Tax=Polycladidibacter hongkongensis TaxID=1647556 RepID=UPI0008323CD0|nr:thioesterase family protein [Pseudovibrio hongkongensis]